MDAEQQPFCLIDDDGQPKFGYFDQAADSLGLDQFRYFNSMDKAAGPFSRYFDYKQFQFISINTGDYIIGAAIADIRYIGTGFCYVYHLASNTLTEQSWLRPAKWGYQTEASATNSQAFIGGSKQQLRIDIDHGQWRLRIDSDNVKADLQLSPSPASQPLAMSSPTAYNGWTYTQKHNGLNVDGELTIAGNSQDLDQALAGYDFSAGYMRRETSWRWSSINNRLDDGRILGLNLATGVNESGFSENCCWLDGQHHSLPAVHFQFQRQRSTEAQQYSNWHIVSTAKSADGMASVALTFTPLNCRQERLNLWLLKSNFRQYIGHYNGIIETADGEKIMINNVLGLSEDHFARW
jgi:hypothetical protein